MATLSTRQSDADKLAGTIAAHIRSLAFPMDSWLEDQLTNCSKYELYADGKPAGYCGSSNGEINFFYVLPKYFRHAPGLMEMFITKNNIERVFVMTQDAPLCSLVSEWDCDIERTACFFVDSGTTPETDTHGTFRTAGPDDCKRIREVCKDFFEEPGGGFNSFEERIGAGTIFMLEKGEELLGCGVIEEGLYCKGCVSIGMFTNPDYRKRGIAKEILVSLKKWSYENGLKPVAGCWYYNTVSRMSLESAGMIAASKGFSVRLKGKEKLPLRTGNPPGELIE